MVLLKKKALGAGALACMLALSSPSVLHADELEDEQASYEQQAQEKLEESNKIQIKINELSEEKRVLDLEADEAIQNYRVLKAEMDDIKERIAVNEARLEEVQEDYGKKIGLLGKRVRDIYINGQISYLDVIFGAKDFQDLMTRMDLLKRVIKQDYDLVQVVMAEREEIETTKASLEKDRAALEPKVRSAGKAKDVMVEKQQKRQALLDKMKSDKATIDREYDEFMAASKKVAEMIQARSSQVSGSYAAYTGGGGGGMIWPISGPITSEFGWRVHPITGTQKFHSGIDIGGDYGEPVVAAASGVVTDACWISGYGNTVIIDHGGGISTLYGHNQGFAVSEGQTVSQGQVIAYCGSTGNSTGPHCHFEVRENGSVVSPYGYL